MAVEALARLPRAHLVVVGGDRPGPFVARAREFGCADRVHFVGPQGEMARWYRAADVLVHPTRYDPFANVCLEALACGTPVVTTPRNGVADLLTERKGAGAVVEGGGALAEAVERLWGEGKASRREARRLAEGASLGAHVERIERVYAEVAGSGE
ncbi:MAG: glycosyltransferase [Candidatus Dadabacteria bacterium]|nr:MAG: glycosyltransferase [Candidatus Dadabacteria bacterium]